MSTSLRSLFAALCASALLLAQTTGSGVSSALQARFQIAFLRGNFSSLVIQPPVADVHAFGSTGLIQEFYTPGKLGKGALVLPDQTKVGFAGDVLQVNPDIYAFYATLGVNTVGYPIEDTQLCAGTPACSYQHFTNNYALFSVPSNVNAPQLTISGNIYLKWACAEQYIQSARNPYIRTAGHHLQPENNGKLPILHRRGNLRHHFGHL